MTSREKEILSYIEQKPEVTQAELAEKFNITRSSVGVYISNLIKKGKILRKEYVFPKKSYVTVIGGANVDIGGFPYEKLKDYDSNPGEVTVSFGGVGRNIAENLCRMGEEVEFITVLGDDMYGNAIKENSKELGMNIENSLTIKNASTSTYLFILDENKNMKIAISAMELYNELTLEYIKSKKEIISNSQICVVDTNISEEILNYIVDNFEIPIAVDCVSTTKAKKIEKIIGKFHIIKVNKIEAEILSGIEIKNEKDLKKTAEFFILKGVNQIFISLGEEGVYSATKSEIIKSNSFKTNVVNTTGAGDAFMAGIIYSYLKEYDLEESTNFAIAAGTIAVESEKTISEEMSVQKINQIMEENK